MMLRKENLGNEVKQTGTVEGRGYPKREYLVVFGSNFPLSSGTAV